MACSDRSGDRPVRGRVAGKLTLTWGRLPTNIAVPTTHSERQLTPEADDRQLRRCSSLATTIEAGARCVRPHQR
ncbi:hypothetical protein [Sphingobium tyrosinilyticum]|uniref:hypothetical protein n=1 Tax=Sphingobium tyrosinilyticum TaxID=2715436 RepID=UPI0036D2D9DC